MKRNLALMITPDDPVMRAAIEAMRRYHLDQQAGLSEAEVERLRLKAEQHFQSINDYQLAALGQQPLTRH